MPGTNPWFVQMMSRNGSTSGILATGKTYTVESGLNDLASIAISGYWFTPVITAGAEQISKHWLSSSLRAKIAGAWTVYVDAYLDRETASIGQYTFNLNSTAAYYDTDVYDTAVYSVESTQKASKDTDRYTEAIQFRVINEGAGQSFTLNSFALNYLYGSEER